METPIYFYNTLHRRKETFQPLNPPEVTLYTCGPTVYDYPHVGNLRAFLFADLLKRMLTYNGYDVTHVMNITDVGHLSGDSDEGEDKMEKGARREGKSAWEVAAYFTEVFFNDSKALNIVNPDVQPKATDHIQEQIALIQELEKKGYTYVIDDGVYFDTSKFLTYGQLAHLDIEGLQEGARVQFNPQKKNVTDFALWKFSPTDKTRDMEWESPWGKGFPGWHIECSAMSMKYLGSTIDIHTGGIDHIPVHHTNEIAQSEAATEKPFVRYWLHNGFLAVPGDEKMSKSKGSFFTLKDIVGEGYHPMDFRFATLQAHYRTPMTFSWAVMDAAHEGRERLNQFVRRISELRGLLVDTSDEKYLSDKQDAFRQAINDDLNAPAAMAVVFDLVKDINSQIANKTLAVSPNAVWNWLMDVDRVLGLKLEDVAKAATEIPETIQELLTRRQLARDNRDFEQSDRLREELGKMGWVVEDTSDGQRAHRQ